MRMIYVIGINRMVIRFLRAHSINHFISDQTTDLIEKWSNPFCMVNPALRAKTGRA